MGCSKSRKFFFANLFLLVPARHGACVPAGKRGLIGCDRFVFRLQAAVRASAKYTKSPRCTTASRPRQHTSELQSQSNLVCRLLLEKKKKNTKRTTHTLQ